MLEKHSSISHILHLLFLMALLFAVIPAKAAAYSPEQVPNPRIHCAHCYASDPDGILSSSCIDSLNRLAHRLEQLTSAEVAFVAIDAMSAEYESDINLFATNLANHFGIGKKENSNGLLVLCVRESHDLYIATGNGMEGLFPDAVCYDICTEQMAPHAADGDFSAAFIAAANAIYEQCATDEAIYELQCHPVHHEAPSFIYYYFIVAFLLLSVLAIIGEKQLSFKGKKGEPLTQDKVYKNGQAFQSLLIPFACLFILPILFYYKWYKKRVREVRYKPIKCSCGATMHLLNEKEDDAHLQASQRTEEKLLSVDYDVWVCPDCHKEITLRYEGENNGVYTRCEECGAKTLKQLSDRTIIAATALTDGVGEHIYECKHCHHRKTIRFTLPKQPPVVIASGGGSHGSFSGGGSFGGGSFSGGGGGCKF